MIYHGKQISGFSYAVNSLFVKAGISTQFSPDCISMRLAVYESYQNSDEWFVPVLQWDDYMNRMIYNMGIGGHCSLFAANLESMHCIDTGTVFLLGEVKYPEWDMTIVHKLCNIHPAFLICKKLEYGFEIENPLGCPSMICDAEQILNLLIEGKSFIFEVERYVQIKVCPEEMLIKELIKLLESHAILTVAEQFRCIQKSVKNKVRFQYGLISYIQSRYHYCEFFSLNKKVQEQLSLIDVTDGTAIDEKIRNTELYFMEALYEAGRKV